MAHRRSSTWRHFPVLAAVVIVVLVALYFILSSSAFLKAVVVPRVGKALNAKVTVDKVFLSPFSKLVVENVKVETTGLEPVIQADRMSVNYSLFQLIGGAVALQDITVNGAKIRVIQQPDGKSNIDPLMQARAGETQPPPAAGAKPTALDIGKITVTKSIISYTQLSKDSSRQTTELSDVELTIENLRNEQPGKVAFTASINQSITPPPATTNSPSTLSAKLDGKFDFNLDANLVPTNIKGDARLAVANAAGAFADLAKLSGQFNCEVTPTEVREVALRFEREGQRLGQVRVRGPIDLGKRDARLTLEIAGIDRHVLNLFGAPFGLDFGDATVSASALLDVSQRMSAIAATGKGTVSKFGLRRANAATPPVDIEFEYQANLNLNDSSAIVHKFNLLGKSGNQELLRASLDRALNLSWGKTVHGLNESVVSIAVSNLRLQDWQMLIGTNIPAGVITASAKLTFQNDGRRIPAEITLEAKDISASFGTNQYARVRDANVRLESTALVTDFRSILADHYKLELSEGNTWLLTATGSAGYDLVSHNANLQINLDADLAAALKYHPLPDVSVASGRASMNALLAQEKNQQQVSAKIAIGTFTGGYRNFFLTNYEANVESDVELTGNYLNIRRLALGGRQVGTSGGSIELSGRYDRVLTNAELNVALLGINQNCLQPILAGTITPRQLQSISINGSASAKYKANSETTVKLDTEINQLLLSAPDGTKTPQMDFKINLDLASTAPNRYEIRKLEFALPQTPKAKNIVQLQAKLDLSTTNATPSTMSIGSDVLDFSQLYDAFVLTSTNQPQPSPAQQPETEPAPISLPISTLTADLKVGKLILRELIATNVSATAKLNHGVLKIDPCNLLVNGAPVSATATVDLTKTGYVYEVSATTTNLPIEPLMSLSTTPSQIVGGNLSGSFQIKGAGITGPNLQKNLAGKFDLGSTNLNIPVAQVKSPILKSVINVVLGLPDLVKRPDAALANLIGTLTGTRTASTNSWIDQLAQAPIDTLKLQANAADGRVQIAQGFVQSAAFQADARGTIALAPVLTNSTLELPVAVHLRRSLAERASLLPDGAPTNAVYVKLPDFLTVKGTVGDPKTDINKLALASLTLKAGAGIAGQTGNTAVDRAAGIVGAVGNLLGGVTAPKTNAPSATDTNAPATKPVLPINPLDLFKKK